MVTPFNVIQALEADFSEKRARETAVSQEDLRFLKIVGDNICKDQEGYYVMPLPFKEERPRLPSNRIVAKRRLDHLKRRFKTDKKYQEDYKCFMKDIIEHGDAERVPESELNQEITWYIPHHGVYHPKKPGKIRVVFDCSSKYRGTSLNDHLLQGPDMTNTLIGVLCRFRQGQVAIMCDVERMFHQF